MSNIFVLIAGCFLLIVGYSAYFSKDNTRLVASRSSPKVPSDAMVQVYKEQAVQRKSAMKRISEGMDGQAYFYNVIVPEAFCEELVRVGTIGDGGKWMCSPQELPEGCVVLSLGLNNAISFDKHIQTLSDKRCKLVGIDAAKQAPLAEKALNELNGYSKVAFIGTEKGQTNLSTLIKQEGIKEVEIVKMDIEGSEFSTLIPFLEEFKVAQIMIEVHESMESMTNGTRLLNQIAKKGYWLISYEINGAHHNLCEFTFMHESAFDRYKTSPLGRYLDF